MSEHEQNLRYLTEDHGLEQAEAEKLLVDDDLWMLEPSQRFAFSDEDASQLWQDAAEKLGTLATIGYGFNFFDNKAITMALADAEERAREAARRARRRVQGEA